MRIRSIGRQKYGEGWYVVEREYGDELALFSTTIPSTVNLDRIEDNFPISLYAKRDGRWTNEVVYSDSVRWEMGKATDDGRLGFVGKFSEAGIYCETTWPKGNPAYAAIRSLCKHLGIA